MIRQGQAFTSHLLPDKTLYYIGPNWDTDWHSFSESPDLTPECVWTLSILDVTEVRNAES